MGPLHESSGGGTNTTASTTTEPPQQYVPGGTQPHAQRKILCLGMSYAELEKFAQKELVTVEDGTSEMHIRRVIECVRRGYLTEMDGRDLVRVVSTEYEASADLYTVSQEEGACYRQDRHMNGNFNRTNFVRRLQEHFLCQEFDQVILDYFWIPAGWDLEHWSRSLFSNTLVELARHDVLPYREPRPDELLGSVILPFCYHCFKEVIANFKQLRRYYDVSFLRKRELEKLPLWRGTQQVGAKAMQYWLGKRRDQEEVYCTFGPKEVNEAGKDTTVSKQKIVQLACQLEDFADIRFIVLTRLAPTPKGERKPKGQWRGLTPKDKVCRGYDSLGTGRPSPPPPPHQEEKDEEKRRAPEETVRHVTPPPHQEEKDEEKRRAPEETVRHHHLPFKKRKIFRMTPPSARSEMQWMGLTLLLTLVLFPSPRTIVQGFCPSVRSPASHTRSWYTCGSTPSQTNLDSTDQGHGDSNDSGRQYWLDLRSTALQPVEALAFLQEFLSDLPKAGRLGRQQQIIDCILLPETTWHGLPNEAIVLDPSIQCLIAEENNSPYLYSTEGELKGSFIQHNATLSDPIQLMDLFNQGQWIVMVPPPKDVVDSKEPTFMVQVSSLLQLLVATPFSLDTTSSGLLLLTDADVELTSHKNQGGVAFHCSSQQDLFQVESVLEQSLVGAGSSLDSGILLPSSETSSDVSIPTAIVLPFDLQLWRSVAEFKEGFQQEAMLN